MGYILVLQGSFNPVTNAHIEMINVTHNYLKDIGYTINDQLIIPTSDSYPYKKLESNEHRSKMIQLAIKNTDIHMSNIETSHNKWMRTRDVMEKLKDCYDSDTLIYICGGDKVIELKQFINSAQYVMEIAQYCEIVCLPRKGYELGYILRTLNELKLDQFVEILKVNFDDSTSSTLVRDNINNVDELKKHLHDDVIKYITTNNLYEIGHNKT